MRGEDLALKLQASKALTNLDQDYDRLGRFQDGVYVYHPHHRSSDPAYVDIVFVPGLLGGPAWTWRQGDDALNKSADESSQGNQKSSTSDEGNDQASYSQESGNLEIGSHVIAQHSRRSPSELSKCWPTDWLAKDCPNVRILTIEYDTNLSDWAPKCPYDKEKRTLHARSAEFVEKLQLAGVGQRPVIWVGHSMGGLLIKKMLLLAQENPAVKNLVNKTKGIVFFSVPHKGSDVASWAASTKRKYILFPSIEVKELVKDSPQLLALHKHFKDIVLQRDIPLLSFGEGLSLNVISKANKSGWFKTQPVLPESSDPGFGQYRLMSDMNHLTICKPSSKESPIYQAVLDFIFACEPHLAIDHVLKVDLLDENILPEEIR